MKEVNDMTIRERFAKYTNEELTAGIARLRNEVEMNQSFMDKFRAEGNVEMFKMAEKSYNESSSTLLDVMCALEARQ